EVVTPTRLVVAETVDEVVVPGSDGYFGVLPGHAAFLTTLGTGEVIYRIDRDEFYLAVSGGFAEVRNDKVIVLADAAERPEEIEFPANYKDHVLYATLDRYDTKQYRELYGTPEAVRAAKEGKPIPSGSVLTLVQYKAQVDAQGNPVKDANGRFVKGEMVAFTVMEKRAGWGAEYPDDLL